MYIAVMKDIKEIAVFLGGQNISELSLKIGVSRYTLHKIKDGYEDVSLKTLRKLSDYME